MQGNYNQLQKGNWVVYLPEGNYCKIKSITPRMAVLEGFLQNYFCEIDCIGKIEITEDKLQVCGFDILSPKIEKRFNDKIRVKIELSNSGVHKLYKNDEEFCNVEFIHEVQNAYYTITGELLEGTLFGVRET